MHVSLLQGCITAHLNTFPFEIRRHISFPFESNDIQLGWMLLEFNDGNDIICEKMRVSKRNEVLHVKSIIKLDNSFNYIQCINLLFSRYMFT